MFDNGYQNRYWPAHPYRNRLMYLCLCQGITDSDVREAGRAGIVMPCQLRAKFGLKKPGCCGRCSKNIHEFVQVAATAPQVLPANSLQS
jgi:bacterioferritin-associated ferredoxin